MGLSLLPRIVAVSLIAFLGACDDRSATKAPSAAAQPAAAPSEANVPAPAGTGTLRGKVIFNGTAPPMGWLDNSRCHRHDPKKIKDESVVVNPNGTLRNVVVYVKGLRGGTGGAAQPVMDQVDCQFVPHVVAVAAGGRVTFRSSDDTLHNVHGRGLGPFNEGIPRAGLSFERTFKEPEFVPVTCDVHPWMRAYVAVMDGGYYALTGDDGTFEVRGVPAGSRTLAAWHERYDVQEQAVTVSANQVTEAKFEYP